MSLNHAILQRKDHRLKSFPDFILFVLKLRCSLKKLSLPIGRKFYTSSPKIVLFSKKKSLCLGSASNLQFHSSIKKSKIKKFIN